MGIPNPAFSTINVWSWHLKFKHFSKSIKSILHDSSFNANVSSPFDYYVKIIDRNKNLGLSIYLFLCKN